MLSNACLKSKDNTQAGMSVISAWAMVSRMAATASSILLPCTQQCFG